MSFPRYPEYKETGIEWLGQIPAHWEVSLLKNHLIANDGGVWGDDPIGTNDTIVLRSTEQTMDGHWRIEDPAFRALSTRDKQSSALKNGDLLITKASGSSFHIGKTTLVTEEIEERGCCYSNFMQRIRVAKSVIPKLGWYVLNNDVARRQFDYLSNSTTGLANINAGIIGKIFLPVIPSDEQRRIVSFLDHETAKIDALVAEQEQLIALLKEKRQAVISHAVTKGLNPDAPMKDSGIEWIGEIPEHWTICDVKSACELVGRIGYRGYTTADIVEEGDGAITLSPSNMRDGETTLEKCTFISWYKYNESPEIMVKTGDILMVKTGSTFGKVAFVSQLDSPATINPQLVILKKITCDRKFLFLALQSHSILASIDVSNSGSTIPTMSQQSIGGFRFAMPPRHEQEAIVEAMNVQMSEISLLSAFAERGIELLQERRTALISAAVTGQIDVRGWADRSVA